MRRSEEAEWRVEQLVAGAVIALVLLLIQVILSSEVPLPGS